MAQQESLKYFTIADGLPSNHIYKCVQDKRGFLWIATENGLSRFDGQRFKNFTVSDGLPDNEILDIFLDSAERLWIIPFSKTLAFLDTKTNKIISNSKGMRGLPEIETRNGLLGNIIDDKRLAFYGNDAVKIIEGNKIVYGYQTPDDRVYYVKKGKAGEIILSPHAVVYLQNGKLINKGPSLLGTYKYGITVNKVIEKKDMVFIFRGDSVMIQLKHLDEKLLPDTKTKKYPFRVWNIAVLNNYIGATGRDGIIYLLNPETLEIERTIETNENVKDITEDKEGNFWVSTDSRGLLKITKPLIYTIPVPLQDKNITALGVDPTGILAGNNSANLIKIKANHFEEYVLVPNREKYNNIIVKKIFKYKGSDCIVSLNGLHLGEKGVFKKLIDTKGFKDAVFINDSTLLLGAYNYLYRYNFNSGRLDTLVKKRITAVALSTSGDFYYGSNDGLYKLRNGKPEYFGTKNNLLSNNVTTLLSTGDNLIWVGTASDTLLALNNDSIILKLSIKNNFKGSICKTLAAKSNGQIWIGTERSLGRIDYVLQNGRINYNCTYFDKSDGLSNGQVNQIVFFRDTVFAATNEGINKLSANSKPIIRDIAVYITRIFVNNKDVDVNDSYVLEPQENNIQIEFSGVDLTEIKHQFQYKINNSEWQNIFDNTLSLSSLAYGSYTIALRTLKRNNQPSLQFATVKIKIKTPLLYSPVIWLIGIVLITAFIFWLINRRKLLKQKNIFQQQLALEQQRNKITADLHDDIGASLSSLQLNSAVAGQLINRDVKQARQVLDKIEAQAKNIADRIGDIIWSMKPGKDEFMTISSRIKNFANDILSATNINYSIQIDKQADTAIKDIGCRKNIVLITKEALNNAVKYSKAGFIAIDLKIENQSIKLSICDDGVGFTANGITGNGLANMKRRTEELNGVFSLKTQENAGTVISCVIPL
ncbi:MAG: hypothetical protein IPP81_03360 [Chitinophagaceae bacterium]|nr:hypothetical protein [Chitinophagaceae bacterium]